MSYGPNAPTGADTTSALRMAWTGLAANTVLLYTYVVGADATVSNWALALTSACMFIVMLSNRFDEHFNALRDAGMRWGMAVITIYLFGAAILSIASGAHSLGHLLSSGELPNLARGEPGFTMDGYLLAVVTSLAFYVGFAVARLRTDGGA